MEPVRLSMVCMHSDIDDVEGNLERMAGFVEAARRQRTDIVCFPETSLSGYTTDPSRIAPLSAEGPMVTKVLDLSAESGVDICFGYVGEGPCIEQSVASGGRIAGTYRKTHLGGREAPVYAAGSEFPVIDLGYAKFGIQLCWESHVTRITEIYARQGADVVLMPHASGLGPGRRRDAWDRMLPARAYDNTVFVAACNLYGDCGGVRFGGGISVRDCRGNLLAEEYGGEKMVTVDLDPEDLERIRSGGSSTMADLYFLDKYRLDILRASIRNVYACVRACVPYGRPRRTREGVGLSIERVRQGARVLRRLRPQAPRQDRRHQGVLQGQALHLRVRDDRPELGQPQGDIQGVHLLRRLQGGPGGCGGLLPVAQEDLREEEGRRRNRQLFRPRGQLPRVHILHEAVHQPRPPVHQDDADRLRQRQLGLRPLLLHPGHPRHVLQGLHRVPPRLHPAPASDRVQRRRGHPGIPAPVPGGSRGGHQDPFLRPHGGVPAGDREHARLGAHRAPQQHQGACGDSLGGGDAQRHSREGEPQVRGGEGCHRGHGEQGHGPQGGVPDQEDGLLHPQQHPPLLLHHSRPLPAPRGIHVRQRRLRDGQGGHRQVPGIHVRARVRGLRQLRVQVRRRGEAQEEGQLPGRDRQLRGGGRREPRQALHVRHLQDVRGQVRQGRPGGPQGEVQGHQGLQQALRDVLRRGILRGPQGHRIEGPERAPGVPRGHVLSIKD